MDCTLLDAHKLRNVLPTLSNRQFGTIMEAVVQKLGKFEESKDKHHDLYDPTNGERIEVKFSRAIKKSPLTLTKDTIVEFIEQMSVEQIFVSWNDRKIESRYDCNIQHVKRAEFDLLYYGIFFSDCVAIYCVNSVDIDSRINFSDKQQKGGTGEGQFHISYQTIEKHEPFLIQNLSYESLLAILKE